MNIALTSLYLPSGSKIGVGYQVHGLANALTRRGHEVTVFSPCPQTEGSLYRTVVVPERNHLRTFRFARDLRKVDFTKFDVLNAHGDDWFLWGVRRPRHIHTYHGSCLAEMLNIKGFVGKMRMGLLAACETQATLLADETVAVSENTRRYIPGIRHIIPCGVNLKAFRPSPSRTQHPTILFVGTMHGRKRGRFLLEIFQRQVRSQFRSAELWCVCERPADIPDGGHIRWLGRIPEKELTDLYGRAWVFCLPSTYEGFGVPYIEAMASGAAVLASPNPGAREVTAEGRFGVLAKDCEFAEQLLRLLGDRAERERLGEAGLCRAQDFSWETVCSRYEALYERNDGSKVSR